MSITNNGKISKEEQLANKKRQSEIIEKGLIYGGCLGAGLAAFAFLRYRVAGPTEYIVRTGLGIDNIAISKKAFQLPFQTYRTLNMEPITLQIEIDAMSRQRIPFRMPSVWTLGPKSDMRALENYASLLVDKGQKGFHETVEGIIQGEARILTANMDLDDLFHNRETFKNSVSTNINEILSPLGLHIYNANIAELADLDKDNMYFSEQKRRALQQVNQMARVEVSEAVRDGDAGEMLNKSLARQKVAEYQRDATLVENERAKDVAESTKILAVAQANYDREQKIAQVEAEAASDIRKWELQKKVEEMHREQRLEQLRATDWADASIEADIHVRKAEGHATAIRIQADADMYAQQMKAEASLFTAEKEAESIIAIKNAQARGLQELITSAGGSENLNNYLLVSEGQLKDLAAEQSRAVQGMKPNVSVWSMDGNQNVLSGTVTDLVKTGVPLYETIKQQTGLDLFKRDEIVSAKL